MPKEMKKIIAETYMELVRERDVDKITVKSLIDACHISRQTCYYHFQDIMDVLEWSARQSVQKLVEQSLQAEDIRSALHIFISFTVENYPTLHKLMESQKRGRIEKILLDAASAYLRELIRYRCPDLSVNFAELDVVLRFSACGLVGVLLHYGGKPRLDQERLTQQLGRILSGRLEGLE